MEATDVVAGTTVRITYRAGRLSYTDATEIAHKVSTAAPSRNYLVEFEQTEDTTTAALARLVVLRGRLLKSGSDLHILGLHGRARDVYEICHLEQLLPQQ